jgi:2-dehydropantoate 2-reductase
VGRAADEGLVEEIVTSMVKGPPEVGTSMLTESSADRRAGQLLEADARNGAVVRIGARRGIETPLNRAMTALLTAIHQEG